MKKFWTALGTLGLLVTAALALTNPPTFAPRQFPSQQTHYVRIDVKYNAINGIPCVLGGTSPHTCTVKIGALPYNAYVVRVDQQIITNFNSGSADTIALGVSTLGTELVAQQSVHTGAGNRTALTVASSGSGIQYTGNGTTQNGADGGFDLYVQLQSTGAVPTAGQAILILEYFAPNDGDCVAVPMGATGTAC